MFNFDMIPVADFHGVRVFKTDSGTAINMGGAFSCYTLFENKLQASIVYHSMLDNFLKEDEALALLYHELHHILIEDVSVNEEDMQPFIIINNLAEIKADEFAVSHVGKDAVKRLLMKLQNIHSEPFIVSHIVKNHGFFKGIKLLINIKKEIRANLKVRFAALNNY